MKKIILLVVALCGCSNFLGRADYYTCPVTQCSSGECCECDCDVAKQPAVDTITCGVDDQDECLDYCEEYCP